MKVIDLIEAISLGQHEGELEQLIKKGLVAALSDISQLKGKSFLKKAETEFAKGEFRTMGEQLRPHLKKSIEASLANTMRIGLGRQFKVQHVGFEDMGSPSAYAQDQSIMINTRWSEVVARAMIQSLFTIITDNYDNDSYIDALYFIPKAIGSGDKDFISIVFDQDTKLTHQTSKLASTLVHELVHITQNVRQQHRDDTEYRSYLDKHKNEFGDMSDKRMSGETDPESDARYWSLYLASPQEIPAFSHQIALQLVNDSGVKNAQTVEQLLQLAKEVDSEWIMGAIRGKLKGRFEDPKNHQEYAVLKRYIKLTYTEFVQYVNHLRTQLEQRLAKQSQDNQF